MSGNRVRTENWQSRHASTEGVIKHRDILFRIYLLRCHISASVHLFYSAILKLNMKQELRMMRCCLGLSHSTSKKFHSLWSRGTLAWFIALKQRMILRFQHHNEKTHVSLYRFFLQANSEQNLNCEGFLFKEEMRGQLCLLYVRPRPFCSGYISM